MDPSQILKALFPDEEQDIEPGAVGTNDDKTQDNVGPATINRPQQLMKSDATAAESQEEMKKTSDTAKTPNMCDIVKPMEVILRRSSLGVNSVSSRTLIVTVFLYALGVSVLISNFFREILLLTITGSRSQETEMMTFLRVSDRFRKGKK